MAISDFENIPDDPDMGVLVVDLGNGGTHRFREPQVADLYPSAKELGDLKKAFPEFPDDLIYNVRLMGRCYVLGMDDSGAKPAVKVIGELARKKKTTFFKLLALFVGRFPIQDIDLGIDSAKNDLTE